MSAVLGLATAVLVIWLLKIFTKKPSVLKKIQAPKGLPILGNAVQLNPGYAVHLKLSDWAKEYGPLYRINLMGKDIVIVNGLKEIHEVLVTKGRYFAGRPNMFRAKYMMENQSDMLSLDYGPDNIYRRKLLIGHLMQHGKGTEESENATRNILKQMIAGFLARENEVTDFRNELQNTIIDLASYRVLGDVIEDEKEREDVTKVMRYAEDILSASGNGVWLDICPWLRFFGNNTYRDLQDMRQIRRAVTAKWRQRAETSKNPQNFIFNLLLIMQGSNEFKLNDKNVDLLTWELFLGSIVTTVATFASLGNILSHKPEIQQKLQQEIDRKLGQSAEIEFKNRDDFPYCYATILEAVRYTTVFPLAVPHKTLQDTSISNYHIPKGTGVWCNLWGLHHNEKIWHDPFEFRPERFLIKAEETSENTQGYDEDKRDKRYQDTERVEADDVQNQNTGADNMEKQKTGADNNQKPNIQADDFQLVPTDHPLRQALMAFGAGPRLCIGEMVAMKNMFMMLVMMMQRLNILPASDREHQPSCDPRDMKLAAALNPPEFKVRFVARV